MPIETVNGAKLNYEDLGDGEPLVMIHGAAVGGKMFAPLIPVMQSSYRLIIPDLRGMGSSERVDSVAPDAWVRDLDGLLDAIGVCSAHLLGCSLGARIVARYAIEYPQRATSVIVDAPIIAMETASDQALNVHLSDIDENSPSAENWRHMHGDDWKQVVTSYFKIRNEPALQDYLSVRNDLPGTTTPTLITRGDFDEPVHPLAHAIEWHRILPSSWLWICPDTGPSAAVAHGSEFKSVLDRFVQSIN